jgi:P-type Cu2+ transporter
MSSHEHNGRTPSAVLHVGNLHYASEKAVVERVLANRPGVTRVEANPVAQTATVEYDPATTSVETLQRRVEECGDHCAGRSVPGQVCDPLAKEGRDVVVHDHAAAERADGHARMSTAEMVLDMRKRLLVQTRLVRMMGMDDRMALASGDEPAVDGEGGPERDDEREREAAPKENV